MGTVNLKKGKVLDFNTKTRNIHMGDCLVALGDLNISSPPIPIGNGKDFKIDMMGLKFGSWGIVVEVVKGDMVRIDFKASGLLITLNAASPIQLKLIRASDISKNPLERSAERYAHVVEKALSDKTS